MLSTNIQKGLQRYWPSVFSEEYRGQASQVSLSQTFFYSSLLKTNKAYAAEFFKGFFLEFFYAYHAPCFLHWLMYNCRDGKMAPKFDDLQFAGTVALAYAGLHFLLRAIRVNGELIPAYEAFSAGICPDQIYSNAYVLPRSWVDYLKSHIHRDWSSAIMYATVFTNMIGLMNRIFASPGIYLLLQPLVQFDHHKQCHDAMGIPFITFVVLLSLAHLFSACNDITYVLSEYKPDTRSSAVPSRASDSRASGADYSKISVSDLAECESANSYSSKFLLGGNTCQQEASSQGALQEKSLWEGCHFESGLFGNVPMRFRSLGTYTPPGFSAANQSV